MCRHTGSDHYRSEYDSKQQLANNLVCCREQAAEKSRPEEGVFAAGPHTDWGMMTLLATDDVPGLQVPHGR